MKPYPLASLNHFTFPLAIRAASCWVRRPALYGAGKSVRLARPYIDEAPFFVKKTRCLTVAAAAQQRCAQRAHVRLLRLPSLTALVRFAAVPRETLVGRTLAGYTLESEVG